MCVCVCVCVHARECRPHTNLMEVRHSLVKLSFALNHILHCLSVEGRGEGEDDRDKSACNTKQVKKVGHNTLLSLVWAGCTTERSSLHILANTVSESFCITLLRRRKATGEKGPAIQLKLRNYTLLWSFSCVSY